MQGVISSLLYVDLSWSPKASCTVRVRMDDLHASASGNLGPAPEAQPGADQPEIDQKAWRETTDGSQSKNGQLYRLGRQ